MVKDREAWHAAAHGVTKNQTQLRLKNMSDSVTPWMIDCQAPLSMGLPRQEYWSGLPFPFPGDLPNIGIKPKSPALAGGFLITKPPGKY